MPRRQREPSPPSSSETDSSSEATVSPPNSLPPSPPPGRHTTPEHSDFDERQYNRTERALRRQPVQNLGPPTHDRWGRRVDWEAELEELQEQRRRALRRARLIQSRAAAVYVLTFDNAGTMVRIDKRPIVVLTLLPTGYKHRRQRRDSVHLLTRITEDA